MSTTQINGGTQIQSGTITNTQIAAGAAIASSKLADGANFTKKDGSVAFTNDQSMGSHKLTNVTDPTSAQDAATKAYVDAAVNGLDWKASVRAATTAAGTLASSFENGDVIDGVTLATGDRILIKNQATASENGIYTVNASGAPTRATDADSNAEVTANMAVFVSEGTTNADTQWTLVTNDAIVLGTTGLTFSQVGGSTTYTGSNGISVVGTVISPTYGSAANTVTQGNDSRLSDARTPTAHATSHQHGGSDEIATATAGANAIPKAGAGGTLAIGWIPTGSTGSTVCIGNDARLSDSRPPNGSAGGDLGGSYPNPTVNQASIAFAFNGVLAPSQITANQNDYAPTSLGTSNYLRLNSDATRNITGLQGGASGRIIIIHNVGTTAIVLKDESASSSAANRFALPGDVQLDADFCIVLQYDSTNSRWRAIGQSLPPFGTTANTICQGNDSRLSTPITRETPSGTINGSNTSFTLANTPIAGTEHVYLNGILQDAGAGNDYTISGATITMLSAPLTGDKLRVSYLK